MGRDCLNQILNPKPRKPPTTTKAAIIDVRWHNTTFVMTPQWRLSFVVVITIVVAALQSSCGLSDRDDDDKRKPPSWGSRVTLLPPSAFVMTTLLTIGGFRASLSSAIVMTRQHESRSRHHEGVLASRMGCFALLAPPSTKLKESSHHYVAWRQN